MSAFGGKADMSDPRLLLCKLTPKPNPISSIANPCCNRVLIGVVPALGKAMRRRDFITVIAGSAMTWPFAARSQQSERMRHIAILMAFSESDSEAQSWAGGFREELGKLGWTEGHNIQIDTRWATADVESLVDRI